MKNLGIMIEYDTYKIEELVHLQRSNYNLAFNGYFNENLTIAAYINENNEKGLSLSLNISI